VAILEDLAVSTRRAKHRRLLAVIAHQKLLLTSWQGIDDAYYKHVRLGYHYLRVSHICCCTTCCMSGEHAVRDYTLFTLNDNEHCTLH